MTYTDKIRQAYINFVGNHCQSVILVILYFHRLATYSCYPWTFALCSHACIRPTQDMLHNACGTPSHTSACKNRRPNTPK